MSERSEHISSYSSPFNLGHAAVPQEFWEGTIYVQEKVDGSQFSFGVRGGSLYCRSRRARLYAGGYEAMFNKALETAQRLFERGLLQEGWTYRCEYLMRPKHNTLAYSRVPKHNLVLFDVDKGDQDYVRPEQLSEIASELSLEAVPLLTVLHAKPTADWLDAILQTESFLGNTKIEGVVFKNYELFGRDKKVLMVKFVSEQFKEVHSKTWKNKNPGRGDILQRIIAIYRTEARWQKAVQHLREAGTLQEAPQDIGPLINEISLDVREDCEEEIKDMLFQYFWKDISRGITRGFPEWYKKTLAKEVLDG